MNQKGSGDGGLCDNGGQCVPNYFQAGECKTSFRFQKRHIIRDVDIEKKDDKLEKQASIISDI